MLSHNPTAGKVNRRSVLSAALGAAAAVVTPKSGDDYDLEAFASAAKALYGGGRVPVSEGDGTYEAHARLALAAESSPRDDCAAYERDRVAADAIAPEAVIDGEAWTAIYDPDLGGHVLHAHSGAVLTRHHLEELAHWAQRIGFLPAVRPPCVVA